MRRTLAKRLLASTASIALVAMLASGGSAQSPQGPTVAAGSIAVTRHGQTTVVTQGTDRGIIDWRSFSIGPQDAVRFDQPGRSSVTLNRVTGAEQSRIDGRLSATGQVWLANPNGVMIGPGGQVNVGGLLATTGRIDPQTFLNAGQARIDQIPKNAGVLNAGSILAGDGGYTALAAAAAENRGVIQARAGTIAMGAGKAMTLDFVGDKLIQFQVTQPLDQKPDGAAALITNSGDLSAPGGAVLLSARAAKGVIDTVVNLKGHVIADSIRLDGGKVLLGDGGKVQIEGRLDVSNPAGAGGRLEITGPEVTIAPTAILNASGAAGGGSVQVKAAAIDVKPKAQITARATETGSGGKISLRADQALNVAAPLTVRGGEKAGDGGAIEAASAGDVTLSSALIADSPNGRGGVVLVAGGLTIAMTGAQISAVGMTGGGMVSVGAYLSDAGFIVASPRLLSLTDSVIDASADFNAPTEMARILDDGRMINLPLPNAVLANARGGAAALAGKSVTIAKDSAIRVRGRDTQLVSLGAKLQNDAASDSAGKGGRIDVAAEDLTHQGRLDASGAQGGAVNLAGQAVFHSGSVKADGSAGKGGNATIVATMNYQATATATLQANGKTDGGAARLLGTSDGTDSASAIARLFTSGTITAQGETGRGGTLDLLGRDILLVAAQLDASGATGGGTIRVGGDWQGSGPLARAKTLLSTGPTTINASALKAGDGGKVVVWSDETTRFGSRVLAKGADGGAGGAVEVSSKGALTYGGTVEAATLLLDPKNIVIDASVAGISSVALTDPGNSPVGGYGNEIAVLPNGNIVVTSPYDSSGGVTQRGAAYLFKGTDGSLISTLTGSTENDRVSIGGVTTLKNGNYVVGSYNWNNGGTAANAGAVTWGSAISGVSGQVSDANSLVGGAPSANVGVGYVKDVYGMQTTRTNVVSLTNGNYLVVNRYWSNGTVTGAVTWGDGNIGAKGAVSAENSLIGAGGEFYNGYQASTFEPVVTTLSNGNYVVRSPDWGSGRGAVTWGDGTTGVKGLVSIENSLVGSQELVITTNCFIVCTTTVIGDRIGSGGVTEVGGGNYVVSSPGWNINAGATTWGNGSAGVKGVASDENSLVGISGYSNNSGIGLTVLANGNYVVASPGWNGNRGAATWGSGLTGVKGSISELNSLVGGTGGFVAGQSVTALTNGNYVVTSGQAFGSGAVTWGDGATGTVGVVSELNSLTGNYGSNYPIASAVTALPNGNYVVSSPLWGGYRGAVTWAAGTGPIVGTISEENSLVGGAQYNDRVGSGSIYNGNGGVTVLTNGNYVVSSPFWNNNTGAVTWGDANAGVKGFVSVDNSLIGSVSNASITGGDTVGHTGVTALTNGNYVVSSPVWNKDGSIVQAGAVTWGNGTTGIKGTVSIENSLIGSSASDNVGLSLYVKPPSNVFSSSVIALPNGNYIVGAQNWNNGGTAAYAGAVTWGDGTKGVKGEISSANSLIGSTANDYVGGSASGFFKSLTVLPNGNYLVASPNWNNGGAVANAGAVTWGDGTKGVTGVVSPANSLVGVTAGDKVGVGGLTISAGYPYDISGVTALSNGDYGVTSINWNNGGIVPGAGAVTLGDGLKGVTGPISAQNSSVGATAWSNTRSSVAAPDGNFIIARSDKGVFQVQFGVSSLSFTDSLSSDVTVSAANLASTLAAGTKVSLQANNDITVNSAINVSGSAGGELSLQAGRSVLVNAPIATANGKLTIIANERASNGVVDANRDPGAGGITMASGTSINTGTGDLILRVNDGAGLTNSSGGDVALQAITARALTVENLGAGSVNLNGVATLGGASAIRAANGDVSIANAMNVSGAGAALDIDAGRDISFAATGAVTTQGGKISLLSDRDGVDGGKIRFEYGGALTSNGGDILLSGGVDPTVGRAQGRGAYSGVRLYGNVIDAGDGAVTMRGAGTKESSNAELRGVSLEDSVITARGGLTLDGIGSSSSTARAYGVRVVNTTLDAGPTGAIAITGVATAAGDRQHGVYVSNDATKSISFGSGGLSITGTASQVGSGYGVLIESVSNMAGPGDIAIFGKGGAVDGATSSSGVDAYMSGLVQSTAGKITITGQRGLPRSRNVAIDGGGTFATVGGDLTINADYAADGLGAVAGDSAPAHGFRLRNGSSLTTATGKIAVYGSAASGGVNASGISIGDGGTTGTITTTSAGGSILLVGRGAGGGPGIFASGATISTLDGAITLQSDNISLAGSSIGAASGAIIIRPDKVSASIGVNGGPGDLQISQAALDQISGKLEIGRTDGTGGVSVGSGLTLKQDVTLIGGAAGLTLGEVNGLTPGGQSLKLVTSGGAINATGPLGGSVTLGNITSAGGVVVSSGPITLGATGGNIKAVIAGQTGVSATSLVNLVTGSVITVNDVTLPSAPAVNTTPTVDTPPTVPTAASTPTAVSIPTVASSPTLVTSQTVALLPTITSTPTRFSTPTVVAPPVLPILIQTTRPAPSGAVADDLLKLQAQILTPPLRFDDTKYNDPETSPDTVFAPRAPSGRGSQKADAEQIQRAAQIGLNAAITLNAARLTPVGGLIPPSNPFVPVTGAALTASRTIKLDPVDSGGPGGQAIAAPSGGSAIGALAASDAGRSPIKGLSFQSRRPSSEGDRREPPLAETPSEINEEAFLD